MLRAIRRPSATARGSIENWSSSSTMSATPLVIWLPEPIATASRARFSAGTSLTPSPIIAVKRPRSASAATSAFFCSGVIRQKIVLRSAALAEPAPCRPGARAPRSRRRRAGRRPRARPRSPSGGRRRRSASGRPSAARMNSIVSAASGRSRSSSTTRARGSSLGGGCVPGSSGRRADASPKATTRRPAAVCSSRRPLRGRAAARARRPGRARRARPARSCGSSRRRRASRRSTSRRRRTAPRRRRARARRDSARRSSAACGCARRPSGRSGRAPRARRAGCVLSATSTETSSRRAVGQRPGLVDADRVDGRERLGRAICWTSVFIRASRTAATARVTLISSTRPSGISVTSPAVAVCAASWRSTLRIDEGEQQEDRERDHDDRRRPQHAG